MSRAAAILKAGAGHMEDRAATYDAPSGERSMETCVRMFNALSGHKLTAEQGWHFMTCLKMVRSQQGGYRADNYEDGAAYFALAGEQAEQDRVPPAPIAESEEPTGAGATLDQSPRWPVRMGVNPGYFHHCKCTETTGRMFNDPREFSKCPSCGKETQGKWNG